MTIYLDENLSEHVANALNSLNKGYFPGVNVVSTIDPPLGRKAPDEKIIPHVGKKGGALITRDLGIARTQTQYALCVENAVIVLFLKLPEAQSGHWSLVRLLIKFWEEWITEYCHASKPPFGYILNVHGIKELEV